MSDERPGEMRIMRPSDFPMGVVPWEDYQRLKWRLAAIVAFAEATDEQSVMRGYVLGLCMEIDELLKADPLSEGRS